jgi:hypothetical protein|tara:strand:- start:49 stop:1095 length:1047 start_codon:yes stop_codon:yes gene_type:complete
MTPSEWASAASKLSRANPKLSRPQIIDLMKENGMPRPPGVENKGTDAKGNLRFGLKTRSKGQTARRKQHEQPSTEVSAENLQRLRQQQLMINNMAAHAGMDGAHFEHYAPSDMTDMLSGEGAPGDYAANRPLKYSKWKTAFEQYNRTKADNRYRLLETPEGARVVDRRFADARVDPYDLPGMDVDESMDIEQIFRTLPFMVSNDLSMRQTQFPGQSSPRLTTSAPSSSYTPVPLGGIDFSRIPQQTKTPPMTKIPPVTVMESNGEENGNGNGNGNGYPGSNGNGNGHDHVDVPRMEELLAKAKPYLKSAVDMGAAVINEDTAKHVLQVGAGIGAGLIKAATGSLIPNY